jgi:hypothetical protein
MKRLLILNFIIKIHCALDTNKLAISSHQQHGNSFLLEDSSNLLKKKDSQLDLSSFERHEISHQDTAIINYLSNIFQEINYREHLNDLNDSISLYNESLILFQETNYLFTWEKDLINEEKNFIIEFFLKIRFKRRNNTFIRLEDIINKIPFKPIINQKILGINDDFQKRIFNEELKEEIIGIDSNSREKILKYMKENIKTKAINSNEYNWNHLFQQWTNLVYSNKFNIFLNAVMKNSLFKLKNIYEYFNKSHEASIDSSKNKNYLKHYNGFYYTFLGMLNQNFNNNQIDSSRFSKIILNLKHINNDANFIIKHERAIDGSQYKTIYQSLAQLNDDNKFSEKNFFELQDVIKFLLKNLEILQQVNEYTFFTKKKYLSLDRITKTLTKNFLSIDGPFKINSTQQVSKKVISQSYMVTILTNNIINGDNDINDKLIRDYRAESSSVIEKYFSNILYNLLTRIIESIIVIGIVTLLINNFRN